jgi:hypothetical protein
MNSRIRRVKYCRSKLRQYRLRKFPGAATAAANMNEHDAHRLLEPIFWAAVVNMPPETPCARSLPTHPPHNVRTKPPNLRVEHHEIEGGHGSPHQRSPETESGREFHPGTVYRRILNTREPQSMETLPTDGGQRLTQISKPHRRQPETLNVLSLAGAVQPPGFDGRQDSDC